MADQKEDFDALLDLVKNDVGLIDKLTDEQVTALRKRVNVYGRTIEGVGAFTCLSITNMAEQYMKRFLMTGLIGFLFRACDEFEASPDEPVQPLDNFEAYMKKHDDALAALDAANAAKDADPSNPAVLLNYKRAMERASAYKKRIIIRKFLDHLFQFNPDKHVRSAYAHNPLDPERVQPAQVTAPVAAAASPDVPSEEAEARANNYHVAHIPPADIFHKWTFYMDDRYEELRTAVQDIYADKPDIEYAINPYKQFDGENAENDAATFVQKHKEEVIADIVTLNNGKWNLMGSFKKNRDRINFYNNKTAVVEEIFKQMEKDKRLGADLMRKKVQAVKKKNVEEMGPDPEELKQYRREHAGAVEALGAEDVSRENKLDETRDKCNFKLHEDCPYDAIQVDVFDLRSGGAQVTKSQFFSQAEAPEVPHESKE